MSNALFGAMISYKWFIVLFALRVASPPTANLSFLAIAIYGLLGPKQALRALLMSWFFSVLNPSLVASSSLAGVLKYLIVVCCLLGCLSHRPSLGIQRDRGLLIISSLFSLFLIFHSIGFSQVTDVSLLKSISWTVTMLTAIFAWSMLTEVEQNQLVDEAFSLLMLILVVSFGMALLGLGREVNGSLQGLMNQPQAFGPTMAVLFIFLFTRTFIRINPSVFDFAYLSLCVLAIFMSSARTAALSIILATSIAIIVSPLVQNKTIRTILPGLMAGRSVVFIVILLIISMLMFGDIRQLTGDFLAKGGDSSDVLSSYELSRGALIDSMQANIALNPYIGIGFGVASDYQYMEIVRDPITGLAISAPIEKGVMPLAVIEELGIPGFIMFCIWFVFGTFRNPEKGFIGVAMPLVIISTNLGESVFFSPGGLGLIQIVLFAWASTRPAKIVDGKQWQ